MRFTGYLTLTIILVSPTRFADAHGFSLTNVGGVIAAENNDPPYFDPHLFGHPLDVVNTVLGRNQTDHGAIDADTPGSGFTIPGDILEMELTGPLWFSSGGAAQLATPGVVLTAEQKVTGATRSISSAGPIGGPVTLTATSAHEMIWSLPFGTPEGAYGFSYRISGHDLGGQPFTPSDPLVLVLTTPNFIGDVAGAEQAIFAVAVPEPATSALLGVAAIFIVMVALRLRRHSTNIPDGPGR